MKILVTGGAGFIASHIADALIEADHQVAVVDNLISGNRANVNENCEFFEMDILSERLEEVFASFKPEVVVHHAAQIDVRMSIRQPNFDANINILGSIRLLELCRAFQVRKIIYASSAAVYGAPLFLGVTEDHPKRPQSFYGVSKYAVEPYIDVFSQLYGLDYTILRYANVYGMRQDPRGEGGVVSIFIDKLLQAQSPVIYGDGEQTRDFIFVKDIVNANLAALQRGSKGTFNISTNQQTSVNELFSLMSRTMEQSVDPVYGDNRPGDIEHSRLDNRSAAEALLWKPQYSLEQGIKETCAYYRA